MSPALSLFARPGDGSIRTRRVAILVADGCDGKSLVALAARLTSEGAVPRFVVDDAGFGAAGRRRRHRGGRQPGSGAGRPLRRPGPAGRGRRRRGTRRRRSDARIHQGPIPPLQADPRAGRRRTTASRVWHRRGVCRMDSPTLDSSSHRTRVRRPTTSSPPSPNIGTSTEKPIRHACEDTRLRQLHYTEEIRPWLKQERFTTLSLMNCATPTTQKSS